MATPKDSLIDAFARIESGKNKPATFGPISVLPDYFVDRFVRVGSIDELMLAIRKKGIEAGGGSVRGVSQDEVKGGNAVNVGFALGNLGATVNLIVIADGLPAETLRATFSRMPNVNLQIIKGRCGYTIAFEYLQGTRHVNVMVSDTGDLRDFDGSAITQWDLIRNSKFVALVNWAANKSGNQLCETVFSFARENSVLTFFDPADLSELSYMLPEFKRRILDKNLIDILSVNENETRIMSKALCNHALPLEYSDQELKLAASKLAEATGATIDLHTHRLSLTCIEGKECISVPCHKVDQKTVTGAGDVWDAADLAGHLANWEPEQRLSYANAAAGFYVSRQTAMPPSSQEVAEFMSKML